MTADHDANWGGELEAENPSDPARKMRNIVLVAAILALLAVVGMWLIRAVPEEYAKLRTESSDRITSSRANQIAGAVAQYHRHTGQYPSDLSALIAPSGPDGFEGPYLDSVPDNPNNDSGAWAYDPRTGIITDVTGTWSGDARPPSLVFSGSHSDWGKMPELSGIELATGRSISYRPMGNGAVLVHLFSDGDADLQHNLDALEQLHRTDAQVVAVAVTATRTSERSRAGMLGGTEVSFPVIDATREGDRILAAVGGTSTPLTFLCDGELNRRARLHGKLGPDAVERAMDEVWDAYEAASMGQERRPEGAPDLESEPGPESAPTPLP